MKIINSTYEKRSEDGEAPKEVEPPAPYAVERPPGILVTEACKGQVYLAQTGKIIKDKAVLYAHHTNDGKITKSVARQLENWNSCGWPVVVVDSTPEELPWPDYITLIRKPNIGSDFGSWSVGLHTMRGSWTVLVFL
jgi:hypothetical protein